MFLQVPNILTEEELGKLDAAIAAGKFGDGRETADAPTKPVKNNLQMERGADGDESAQLVIQAIARSPLVQRSCMPSRVVRPLFSRYEAGMEYGWHTDNPLMAEGRPLRTDISVTVFLREPDSYEGGDLVVNTAGGQARFKLPRGHAILYPSTTIHSVAEVTKGVRDVAVTWIQSIVGSAERRELLHELDTASRIVREKTPNSDEARLLMKCHGNLLRMWSDV
jgi:PKHD-type hydroxylase